MSHYGNNDKNRRELNLKVDQIEQVIPEDFRTTYPKFIRLLEYYYEWMEEEGNPTELLKHLFESRDITQTDIDLLSFIEDELLLGQSYFEGFDDKRAAAKFSNTLYRSKGTKYSIQQFFRSFFGIDPEVIYTKENVFVLNDSKLGGDSFRYLTDDKLYQTFAILIRSGLPIKKWVDIYKLFVHPAGVYIGGEVRAQGIVDLNLTQMPDVIPSPLIPPIRQGIANSFISANQGDNSFGEWDAQYTDGLGKVKFDLSRGFLRTWDQQTLGNMDQFYPSLLKMIDGFVVDGEKENYPGTPGVDYASHWMPIYPDFSEDSGRGVGLLTMDLDSDGIGLTPTSAFVRMDHP